MLHNNPTHKPPLEQKPLHTGHNRREIFAEPSNCSANTHCKQILQKSLTHLTMFPENTGQP
jgi:hypothetical protein